MRFACSAALFFTSKMILAWQHPKVNPLLPGKPSLTASKVALYFNAMGYFLLAGSFTGHGHKILSSLAKFLRSFGFPVHLSSELHPVDPKSYTPEEARRASFRAVEGASAILFVALSPETLGISSGQRDITGGWAFELGAVYALRQRGQSKLAAFLFDGKGIRLWCSSLLRGQWLGEDLEAVMENPGDLRELQNLAFQLCLSLEARLKKRTS